MQSAKNLLFIAIVIASLSLGALTPRVWGSETKEFSTPRNVANLLNANCLDCHDADAVETAIANNAQDRRIRLDNIDKMEPADRLDLFNRIEEQLFTNRMPPPKKKMPISDSDALLAWVSSELKRNGPSRLDDKLRFYKYGNYISHEKLFSGEISEPPFTPARRWIINEFIYRELTYNVFRTKIKDYYAQQAPLPQGMVQPFVTPAGSGVKYYDTEVVEGGQFLTLLDNAKYVVGRQLLAADEKTDNYVAPPPPTRNGDHFRLKTTEPEFEKLVLAKGTPADADLQGAITRQFTLALQRPPSSEEMAQYLHFMKNGIKDSGTRATLEKMMISVLMEPDFLYRREFGDGQRDAYGRMKLTPREASYAISYAITDQLPDQALIEAATTGKLATKDDYRREALRIINDDTINKTRIIRFFQDYFGYYNVYNIFKDEKRFGGSYNPHRASSRLFRWRVPEKVTEEADNLVKWILKEDKDVLKQLLTTEKFFVHHNGNNEQMAKFATIADEASKKYAIMHDKVKKSQGDQKIKALQNANLGVDRKLLDHIADYYNDELPNRRPLPYFDEALPHAITMYNLSPKTWSYEAVQPVKVQNRMGILTHPAWLVSFAKNAETDPIHRGKWIREKLLAGIVPDVPISVEAQVPEAHDKTLRQRISSVTGAKYCSSCHSGMDPLGNPLENFDDFGRYRTEEMLEHPENIIPDKDPKASLTKDEVKFKLVRYKTLPVDSSGALSGTGDTKLDGEVKDAFDLIQRLSKSDRVRQAFIRNVFRYFMGRNEMLSDSKTLIEADKAYLESGGSFKALMVSLLTSDSFIYRK